MSVKIKVSSILRKYTNRQECVEVKGGTPLECLHDLEAQFPAIKRMLYDKQGALRPQFWFFVNGQKIQHNELNRLLKDGDEVLILLAISGG
jgi:molybdopterin converting factor small subunit